MPRYHEAFFECSRCGTLHGGIFTEESPSLSLITRASESCEHHWVRIHSKRQFMRRTERRWPHAFEMFRSSLPRTTYWDDPKDIK